MKFRCIYTLASVFISSILHSQSVTITGTVLNDETKLPVGAVSVKIKNSNEGTYTDDKGIFKLNLKKHSPPLDLIISSIGYGNKEISVTNTDNIVIGITPVYQLGQDIVVAASRSEQRILESPVSIERVNSLELRRAAAPSFYDVIGNLKGVDVLTSSLTFKTYSTRGFGISGNARVNQLVNGMDNQAPALNFAVANMVGLVDLDVDNVELIQGASSALYGSGGMNGTILITGKDPFKHPGLSVQLNEGVDNIDNDQRKAAPYHDFTFRWAQKVLDRFAFKLTGEYLYTKDWLAKDRTNYLISAANSYGRPIPGTRASDPNYNGVNVYGDEVSVNLTDRNTQLLNNVLKAIRQSNQNDYLRDSAILSPYLNETSGFNVSRTGYDERDIIDPKASNLRFSGGLYYNITKTLQLSGEAFWGLGNAVYTGGDRYSLKDFKIGQYKIELKDKNWFIRGYTTQENSGESFNATVTTILTNEAWRRSFNPANPAGSWYPLYAGAFIQSALQVYNQAGGGQQGTTAMLDATATLNNIARAYADQGRPDPGSAEFRRIFDSVRKTPIPNGGLFLDRSGFFVTEGQYNFTNWLQNKFGNISTELMVGASWKQYVLNSKGTLFDDGENPIHVNEEGIYAQVGQPLFNNVLKLTASGRYDKHQNFKGHFTPRFTAVLKVTKDNFIRASYQTAYRFPTNQNQYIDVTEGNGIRIIGGLPFLREKYGAKTNPWYSLESVGQGSPKIQEFGEFKPETVNSFEAGYKGLLGKKFLIDVYGYYARYKDFLGRISAVQFLTPSRTLDSIQVYSVSVNSTTRVSCYGWGLSLNYLLPKNFTIGGNLFSDVIKDVPANFVAQFNCPKYRTNISFGNSGFLLKNNLGFNIVYRWQDAYQFESDFTQGPLPAFSTLDAQISYKISKYKSLIKIGGTNIINHYYRNGFGDPSIGGLYYISLGYNVF